MVGISTNGIQEGKMTKWRREDKRHGGKRLETSMLSW
jgi:hypothetical protein